MTKTHQTRGQKTSRTIFTFSSYNHKICLVLSSKLCCFNNCLFKSKIESWIWRIVTPLISIYLYMLRMCTTHIFHGRIISGWYETTGTNVMKLVVVLYPIYLEPDSYCLNEAKHADRKCNVAGVFSKRTPV